MELAPEDRNKAVLCILHRLDEEDGMGHPEENEAAWLAEAERRLDEIEEGKVKCIPWDDVMRRMREQFGFNV
ncbi:hypothetical protein BH09SUM1_BH09SUM1_02390 [soil metagenome]